MSPHDPPPLATTGPVRVVGTGLLGASIGLALSTRGADVVLHDQSPTTLALARDVGAGRIAAPDDPEPTLVVVATPPDVTGAVVLAELAAYPHAVVTDVAGVKASVLADVRDGGGDLERYVGSHPMAGRERSGPTAAMADLFIGRPWVITDSGASSPAAVLAVRELATDLGAVPVTMGAEEHDHAVALVSHLPQLAASLVAARLVDATPAALGLAGQGLRDVTRIAASDPALWAAIITANAGPVRAALQALRDDLDALLTALDADLATDDAVAAALGAVARVVSRGNAGVQRVPGKHGGAPRDYDVVRVLVPDRPGELARLLHDVGAAGVNLEDLQLEHSPRQPVGLAALSVLPGVGERLTEALSGLGWRLAS